MSEIPDYPEELLAAIDASGADDDDMATPASHEAIKRAAQRWDEFVRVNKRKGESETIAAGYTFAAFLGIPGEKLDHAVEWLKTWTDDPSPSQGTMGLLFGLLIADETKLERELDPPAGD